MITWRLSGSGRVAVDENQGRAGGRWHSPGRPLLYTADSCALAVVEFVVHLDTPPPENLVAVALSVPDALRFEQIHAQELPDRWRATDGHPCRSIGDRWLDCPCEQHGAILRVPSAVVPQQQNWLADPLHPDAARIRVVAEYSHQLDARLVDPDARG